MNYNKGFTLVELLITLAVSGVLMTGVYGAFQSQQNSYVAQDQVVEMQQNVRAGLDMMVQELRMAGYDVNQNGSKTGTAGITIANATTITFSVIADADGDDNNGDGTIDEPGELKIIQYDLYDAYGDGDTDLGRQVGAIKRAVAENIDALELYYTLADGTQTLTPADPSNVRSIEISILARADHPDRNFTNNRTYTSASGVTWDLNGGAAGLGNPPNDKFRRRFQTMNVKCRNVGF